MDIRSTRSAGAAHMALEGELDVGTAPTLERAVDEALDAGCEEVVLDLSATTFLDSAGLGALIRAANRADARQARMSVTSPHGSEARLVIEMSRTSGVLGLRDD